MITKKLKVANKKGLHARPAGALVQLAAKFDVSVTVANATDKVNGKSIMGLLTLGAVHESELTVSIDGPQAEEAMKAFEDFFSKQEEEYNHE